MSLFGPPDIKKLLATRNVDGLLKATKYNINSPKYDDEKIRGNAIEALGEIGDARAVVPLIDIYTKKEYSKFNFMREKALAALGNIRDVKAVEPLINALQNSNHSVQMQAADCLGKIGDPKAVGPLITLLKDKPFYYAYIYEIIIRSLGLIGDRAAVESLIEAYDFDWDVKNSKDRSSIGLKFNNSGIKKAVVVALGNLGGEQAIKKLTTVLRSKEDIDLRREAANSLYKLDWLPEENEFGAEYLILIKAWDRLILMGDTAINPLISAANKFSGVGSRDEVITALGAIGDERVIEPLIAVLKEPYTSVFSEEDGEIYAAGVLVEQEHTREIIQLRKVTMEALKKICEKGQIPQSLKESTADFLNSYSINHDLRFL